MNLWNLEIFNRWGEPVAKIPGYKNDWDAKDVSSGVYYYHLHNPVTKRSHRGWVSVMK